MNAKHLSVLFLSIICLTSCQKEEWDLGETETADSTVIEGEVLSSNGLPLAGIDIKFNYYESAWLQYSTVRHKAETKTDQNGKYRLHFQIKDDEQEEDDRISRSYSLTFDLQNLNPKEYILPGDMAVTSTSVNPPVAELSKDVPPKISYYYCPERSTTYTENLYIPRKRYIEVTLTGFQSNLQNGSFDYFEITNSFPYGGESGRFLFPDSKYGLGRVNNLFVLYIKSKETFKVPFALDERNIIELIRNKNGVYSSEKHELFVTEDSPKNLTFEY